MAKTIEELKKAADEAQAALAKAVATEKAAKITAIKADIALFGITAKELGFKLAAEESKEKGSTAPANPKVTYRDANGNEWVGNVRNKGQRPQWIRDLIKTNDEGEKDYSAVDALEVKA